METAESKNEISRLFGKYVPGLWTAVCLDVPYYAVLVRKFAHRD